MKITYNVLWVEDNASWYETTCELFAMSLFDQGFKMFSNRCSNIEEVRELNRNGGLKKFDLLLVDFTLGNTATGDEVINYLRDLDIYTDVIFYSSAVEHVRESMHKHGLEGVYAADRKDIESKFEIVFNTTIKKIQEINSMRGLIVGETCEMDVLIEDISLHITNKMLQLSEEELDKIIKEQYIDDYVIPKLTKEFDTYKELGFNNYFNKIEVNRKWKIFRSLLKMDTFKSDSKIQAFLIVNARYFDEIIDIRNKFAHAKSFEDDGKTVLKGQIGKEHFEYDDKKFVAIRRNINKHVESFQNLVTHLGI